MESTDQSPEDYPKSSSCVIVDDVWRVLRPWGRYQLIQVPIILLAFFPTAYGMLIHVFIGYTPEFHCRNVSRPLTEYGIKLPNSSYSVKYGQCHIEIRGNDTHGQKTEYSCPDGYHYSTEQSRSTIITEWDMVCDRHGLGELSQTLVMVGQIVGAVFLSPLPDRYGRKPVLVAGQVLAFALCVSASFSPTYAVFCVLRFLVGVVIQCLNTTAPVMCLELFPTEYRGSAGIITNTMWSTGVLSLTIFGYFLRNLSWRYIQLVSALSCVMGLFSFWTLDESLRWLVANNRRREAMTLVRKVARWNRVSESKAVYLLEKVLEGFTITIESTEDKEMTVIATKTDHEDQNVDLLANDTRNGQFNSKQKNGNIEGTGNLYIQKQSTAEREDLLTTNEQKNQQESKTEHITYLDMFRNRKLLRNTSVLSLCWFSTCFGYMGLFLVPSSFTTNIYINYFINSIVEFPGLFIMLILINRVGRRWLTMSYFGLAGVAIVSAVSILLLTSRSDETTNVIGAVTIYIGKFSISGVMAMLYIYTPELYPTNVRNIGYGITGCAGRLGAMAAPFLKVSASLAEWVPGATLIVTFIFLHLYFIYRLPWLSGYQERL
ncbi:organic anion transporter 3-like isoform X2 [Argopecten irradians]|uniref:organic anion transporter 3-like isoform X2 n=1 Tax=Argopecten irradians TaxID=31199 RepID=UPI0037181AF1